MPQTVGPDEIDHAARLLRSGKLVAFPTETVYGLGANALYPEAVASIYRVKRRPPTSPLIVHVSSIEMAQSLVAEWPEIADRLAKKFWPGPLTLVLPTSHVVTDARVGTGAPARPVERSSAALSSRAIPPIVTAGLPNVALRMPAHPIALALIQAAGIPLAAPSANRFTELSPTTAAHVRDSLGSEVDYILDGGPCQVGIESTVLSLVASQPVLLRPGAISRQQLEALIGPVLSTHEVPAGPHPAPGMHPRHYSPRTTLYLVTNGKLPDRGQGIYLQHKHPATSPNSDPESKMNSKMKSETKITTIQMPAAPADYAAALYEKLHQADAANADWIAVDQPPNAPEWEAVQDRLRRAATKK
jgi:L-threonylcarbamoyladenylate synthase